MVDMFSPTYFAEPSEDLNTGTISVVRTASPKIGILGNSTFAKQNGTKKVDMEPTNTVSNQFKRVEVSICFSDCFRIKW